MSDEYVPVEFPKWCNGAIVYNAAEEFAHRAAVAEPVAEPCREALGSPPSSAALRMRRSRQRRREGKLLVQCTVSTNQIGVLAEAGLIRPANISNAAEVARAIGMLLDQVGGFEAVRPITGLRERRDPVPPARSRTEQQPVQLRR